MLGSTKLILRMLAVSSEVNEVNIHLRQKNIDGCGKKDGCHGNADYP